jgi:hypothetical protein
VLSDTTLSPKYRTVAFTWVGEVHNQHVLFEGVEGAVAAIGYTTPDGVPAVASLFSAEPQETQQRLPLDVKTMNQTRPQFHCLMVDRGSIHYYRLVPNFETKNPNA